MVAGQAAFSQGASVRRPRAIASGRQGGDEFNMDGQDAQDISPGAMVRASFAMTIQDHGMG